MFGAAAGNMVRIYASKTGLAPKIFPTDRSSVAFFSLFVPRWFHTQLAFFINL